MTPCNLRTTSHRSSRATGEVDQRGVGLPLHPHRHGVFFFMDWDANSKLPNLTSRRLLATRSCCRPYPNPVLAHRAQYWLPQAVCLRRFRAAYPGDPKIDGCRRSFCPQSPSLPATWSAMLCPRRQGVSRTAWPSERGPGWGATKAWRRPLFLVSSQGDGDALYRRNHPGVADPSCPCSLCLYFLGECRSLDSRSVNRI